MQTSTFKKQFHLFRKNRRAYFSLIIFTLLFFITLCAELVANDKPLLISFNNNIYLPFVKTYPETTFGGDFDTEADYKDEYVIGLIETNGFIIWPLIPYSYDTHIDNLKSPAPSRPDKNNWLGTDDQARDVLARSIYGFRVSVLFALALTFGSSIIGVLVGAAQGYFGGKFDLLGQRFLEVWSGLPVLFLLIILASMVTPNFWWLLGIMMLFSWTSLVDVVRAESLKTRKLEYVKAARSVGLSDWQILLKHVLPNALVAAITFLPFIMASAVATLTSLDYLGFGLPPGSASLGELLAQGKSNIHAPWLGLSGFITVALLLSLVVFIGEGIRDALDPRLNK